MTNGTFDVRQTRAYAGLLLHRIFGSPVSYVLYIAFLLPYLLDAKATHSYTLVFVVLGLLCFGLHVEALFVRRKLEDDTQPVMNENNCACYVTFDVLVNMRRKGKVTVSNLLKAALHAKRSQFMLHMLGTSAEEFLKRSENSMEEETANNIVFAALQNMKKLKQERITGPILLFTFLQQGGVFKEILHASGLSLQDAEDLCTWEIFYHRMQPHEWVLHPNRLVRSVGAFGRSWVQGYTSEIERISEDISGRIAWRSRQRGIMIHTTELESAVHILSRSGRKNMLLVGQQGAGKRSMAENIGTLLREEEIKHGRELTRVLLLKTEELMSGYKYPDRMLLQALKKAEKSGKFLLIIQNIAVFLASANPNVRTVLSKFLQSNSLSVIALTTPDEYHQHMKSSPALDSMFEKIQVPDADEQETLSTVMTRYFRLVNEHSGKIHATYRSMNILLSLSRRYIGEGGMPGKALNILEDAVLTARNEKKRYVTEEHIRKAVSRKASIDIEEMSDDDKDVLLQLEDALRMKIVGQNEAISALVSALKRARMDIHAGKRPLGTFLFLGPTGVGKTYTAKILAEKYFGSTDALIRVDMNEYGTEESVYGITGDPKPSEESRSYLSKRVQDHPFSLILLDEIEKAHPKVLNVFLQILDEGHLTDNRGVKTDFRNTIIIATSNAGALFIRDFVKEHEGQTNEDFKDVLVDTILRERIFSPEFVNRFDEVLLYYPMTMREAIKVALFMLDDIVTNIAESKGFVLHVEEDVVAEIVKQGFSLEFGAREMRRVIVDVIENYLADYLLAQDVQRGDNIAISLSDIQNYLPIK